jgi:[acyl-carrier-protein] S-malonyltransferase
MHSSVFGPLRRKFEDEVLGDLPLSDPCLPIVTDQDGSVVVTAEGVRAMLLDGFVRPVRWPEAVQSMKDLGITKIYISGPDSLFGRVPCTTNNFDVISINSKMLIRRKVCGNTTYKVT